jgi:hypothetical protein
MACPGRSSFILKSGRSGRSDGIPFALTRSFPCPLASGSAPRSGIVSRTRAGRAAPGADPARRGQDRESSEPRHEPTVLTDLLTTTLDHHGHGRTEEPDEQGRRDRLDSRGRP